MLSIYTKRLHYPVVKAVENKNVVKNCLNKLIAESEKHRAKLRKIHPYNRHPLHTQEINLRISTTDIFDWGGILHTLYDSI